MDKLAHQVNSTSYSSRPFTPTLGQRVQEKGVNPVNYTYNSMINSCVKKGYYTEAWAILTEMGEKLCPADIATYNMIIQDLGKMGREDLASAILDRLLKQGVYLDIVMYNTLIDALGKAGRIDEVNKFFEQMKSNGMNPDDRCWMYPNHVTDTTLDYLGREIVKRRYQRATILSEKVILCQGIELLKSMKLDSVI